MTAEPSAPPTGAPGPLHGVRVIEVCDQRGAFAGKLLADAGAAVIKVEPPDGDPTRRYPPFLDDEPGAERSLTFWHYNTSKQGVTLDLEQERGRTLFRRLVASADMLVESEPPGRMAELRLDYPDLRPLNAGLIMVSITPFGRDGPRAEQQATDLTLMAGGGPVWSCGYDDHDLPPVRGGGDQGYQTGCHFAVIAALVALVHRDRGGEGQHIDVNMHAAANVTTEAGSYSWLVARETVQRQTGRHAAVRQTMPSQIRCADGRYVNATMAARRPEHFGRLREWLEDSGLSEQFPLTPLLEAGMRRERIDFSRIAEDDELREILGAGREVLHFIAERLPAYEFFTEAQQHGFQVGVVYAPEEAIEDPHFVARSFPVEVEHPELGRSFRYPGAPYRFGVSPWRIRRRAPLLGEDNDAVYGALGLSDQERAALRAGGVI